MDGGAGKKICLWTREENKIFESMLADMDPSSLGFFDVLETRIPSKTRAQIIAHFENLLLDLKDIEAGRFIVPNYERFDGKPFELKAKEVHSPAFSHFAGSQIQLHQQPQPQVDLFTQALIHVQPQPHMQDDARLGHPSDLGKVHIHTQAPIENRLFKKGVQWTDDEHKRFLEGLERYGKGQWKRISEFYVKTKTASQVASHSQKYFLKLARTSGKNTTIPDTSHSYNNGSIMQVSQVNTNFMQENHTNSIQANQAATTFNMEGSSSYQATGQMMLDYNLEDFDCMQAIDQGAPY